MRNLSGRRWTIIGVFAVLVVAVPAMASQGLEDVTPGSTHAAAIAELVDAGVIAGCAPGRYCPEDAIRRDQLASLIARSTPRAASDSNTAALTTLNDHSGVPASVTVQATGIAGGTGLATLQGSISVLGEGNLASCPCEVEAFVYRASDEAQGPSSWSQLPGQSAGTARASTSLAVTWQTEIGSGTTETFRIAVFLNGVDGSGPTEVSADATLTAITTALP